MPLPIIACMCQDNLSARERSSRCSCSRAQNMDGLRGAFKRKGGLFDNEIQVRGKAANKPDDINPEEPREKKGTESSSKTPKKDDVPTDQGVPARPPYA